MKPTVRTFILTVAGLVILVGGLIFRTAYAQTPTPTPQVGVGPANGLTRTVSVSGVGQVSAVPDRAVFRIGVQTDAESASEALNQNNTQMNALLQALRGEGVAQQDIQTQAIQLFPRFQDRPVEPGEPGTIEIAGYTAINIVEVRVRNLTNVGPLLDSAIEAGGNTIEGIRFEVSDQTQLFQDARAEAIDNARDKAEHLTGLLDSQLGQVLSIRETTITPFAIERAVGGVAVDQASVEPGMQLVEVQVEVTWLLE